MGILSRFQKEKEAPEKKSLVGAHTKTVQTDVEPSAQIVDEKKTDSEKKTVKKVSKHTTSTHKKPAYTTLSKKVTTTILRPVVSEKSARMADEHVLVFDVALDANRIAVKQAFKELYRVMPIRVNLVSVRGKNMRFGRIEGKQANRKKAYIAIPKGTHIDIFEGV